MAEFLRIADLKENDVMKIRGLESSLDSHIMAYKPGLQMANLTDDQLQEVKSVEKELGVILLAYDD